MWGVQTMKTFTTYSRRSRSMVSQVQSPQSTTLLILSYSLCTVPTTTPSFEEIAVNWLALNVTNPYPSREEKSQLCTDSGTGADELDKWFHDKRRDIGWTALCKEKFAGSKKALKDAWDRIVNSSDIDDDAVDLLLSFSQIQRRIDALHTTIASHPKASFTQSHDMKAIVPVVILQGAHKKRSRSADYEGSTGKIAKRTRFSSVPKPSYTAATKLSTEPPVASLKRRRSSSDEDAKPIRRPSPAKPTTLSLKRSRSPEDEAAELHVQTAVPQQSFVSRKRRLSDSDSHVQRKRPFGQVKTRLHAVSDPLIAFTALPEIIPKVEQVEPSEVSTPGPLFPSTLSPFEEVEDVAPIVLSHSATSLFCQDPSALPPLSMSSPYISESSPLEISICHWPLESTSPSATAKTVDIFPLPEFLPPLFDFHPAMDCLSLPSPESTCPELDHSGSGSPCPELDDSVSPSVADSPLPMLPVLQCDEISEKLRQLQKHQEAARKLEAEILCSTVLAAVA
ncbi:hypothetical protein BDV98DRAFT_137967 [Pterulicium gracile]|uniref:KN homeodomain domain-containing protein n=1 Tax=Pterulicium gracile TaxID=1884261 RepID=A0A5C3QVW0_9AGAR|nr:hypothetical protein BDV98DRAFT_137967 [Pterula gracilis]